MSTSATDRATVRFPPPFIFALAIAAGVALNRWVLPLGFELSRGMRWAADAALVAGAVLVAWAILLFVRSGQDPAPWTGTPEMIFRGPYRLSRNPMYLAMAFLQTGAGLRFANGWILAFVPLTLIGVYRLAIRHEEAYLEGKFGDAYLKYKASVRRWL